MHTRPRVRALVTLIVLACAIATVGCVLEDDLRDAAPRDGSTEAGPADGGAGRG